MKALGKKGGEGLELALLWGVAGMPRRCLKITGTAFFGWNCRDRPAIVRPVLREAAL